MKKVLAIVLAGGRGKRMDVLCHNRPKPSLPFAGSFQIIDFTLSNCIHSGIRDIAILTDYQRSKMANYLRQWCLSNTAGHALHVLEPKAGSYSGTAGAVYQNTEYILKHDADTILILAADHVYKMDYRKMLSFHHRSQADATVGVVAAPIEQAHRFGVVKVDTNSRIIDFLEKPRLPQSNLVSMGIYIFGKNILVKQVNEDAREPYSSHDFGHDIIPKMVKEDRVFAFEFIGYWQDIGTAQAYYESNIELTRTSPSFSLDSRRPVLTKDTTLISSKLSKRSKVTDSIISPGCVIKGKVENSILSPYVRVEEGAVVRSSVIMSGALVGEHSSVDQCVLDEDVIIGKYCRVGFGATLIPGTWDITVIGKAVKVPPYTTIGRNCRVLPNVGPTDFTTSTIPSGTMVSPRPSFMNSQSRRLI